MILRAIQRTVQCSTLLILILLMTGCAFDYTLIKREDWQELQQHIATAEAQQHFTAEQIAALHEQEQQRYQFLMEDLSFIFGHQQLLLQQQQEWQDFVRTARFTSREKERELAEETPPDRYETSPADKQLVGAVEKIFLVPPGVILPARIDTGATTSSLDARNLEYFERNGDRWVRFTIFNPDDESEINLERKVIRNVRILQAVADESERRPVIELGITIGKTTQTAQFTLSDRRHLQYPLLIGRNILMDILVVDVSQSNIAPPQPPAEPTSVNGTL